MTLDDNRAKPYVFSREELTQIRETFNTPLMQAFLQAIEYDAITAKHEVDIIKNIPEVPLRIIANMGYTQGQVHLARRLRNLPDLSDEQSQLQNETTHEGE